MVARVADVSGRLTVNVETFDALHDEWVALLPRAATPLPFQSVEWAEAWWRVFGAGSELLLISIRDAAGSLRGLAPLMLTETELGRTVRLIGGVDVVDYLDIVAAEADYERVWDAVLGALRAINERWDALDFHCLPPWTASREIVPKLLDGDLDVGVAQEEVCPVVALGGSFHAYLRTLEKKERHEIRRKARNFERDAPAGQLRVLTERTDALAALPDFYRLHRLSAPDKDRFWTPENERFFAAMTAAMADAGWLRLYLLSVDSVAVAAMFTLTAPDRLLIYNSGFDPSRSNLSTGMVLTGMVLEDAAERGAAVADFLRGNESYKYRFGATDTPIWRVLAMRDARLIDISLAAMTQRLVIPADARDRVPDDEQAQEAVSSCQ